MIETTVALPVILAMALITVLTRIGGVVLMGYVPLTRRIERALDALVGSVLVALIAPPVLDGDLGAKAAVVVAVALTWATRQPLLALAAGVAAAAGVRALT